VEEVSEVRRSVRYVLYNKDSLMDGPLATGFEEDER
jgi:hypothetical protein